jgi:hypothetical protein
MEQNPSWEANRVSASQEIRHIYGTRTFITAFTSALNLSLSWASSMILIIYSQKHTHTHTHTHTHSYFGVEVRELSNSWVGLGFENDLVNRKEETVIVKCL